MVADPVPLQLAAELFPNGISRYAVGGLLVGLGAVVIYIGTGIPAGASTFLESTLSYVSGQSRFQQYVSSGTGASCSRSASFWAGWRSQRRSSLE